MGFEPTRPWTSGFEKIARAIFDGAQRRARRAEAQDEPSNPTLSAKFVPQGISGRLRRSRGTRTFPNNLSKSGLTVRRYSEGAVGPTEDH